MPEAATSAASGPLIIAVSGDPATIQIGATYQDLGARITAPELDLNLGITTMLDGATTTNATIDTSKPATHTITYTITDPKGLTGSATRTVIVSALSSTTPASSGIDINPTTVPCSKRQSRVDADSDLVSPTCTGRHFDDTQCKQRQL